MQRYNKYVYLYIRLYIRKKETNTLLENGKVIVCFIYPIELINAEIKNTSNYEIFTNYDFLPIDTDFLIKNLACGKGNSNSIKLINTDLKVKLWHSIQIINFAA